MGPLTVSFTVRLETGELDEFMYLKLSRLIGKRPVALDETGRLYFDMPSPFEDLRIFQDETLTPEKAAHLAAAVSWFDLHPKA